MKDRPDMPDELDIVCEFPLADASDFAQQPLPPDESVYCHHIIGAIGKKRGRRHFEIHERRMVAKHQEWRLQSFHPCPFNMIVVLPKGRVTQNPGDGTKVITFAIRFACHVEFPYSIIVLHKPSSLA
jgi:hypothetical protein